MSEDLVNKITLDFLISKNQLQKLKKKINDDCDNNLHKNKEIYNQRIQDLFNNLINNQQPDDILLEVKTGFDFFVEKCIYYFTPLKI
jgi:hypothetical protein